MESLNNEIQALDSGSLRSELRTPKTLVTEKYFADNKTTTCLQHIKIASGFNTNVIRKEIFGDIKKLREEKCEIHAIDESKLNKLKNEKEYYENETANKILLNSCNSENDDNESTLKVTKYKNEFREESKVNEKNFSRNDHCSSSENELLDGSKSFPVTNDGDINIKNKIQYKIQTNNLQCNNVRDVEDHSNHFENDVSKPYLKRKNNVNPYNGKRNCNSGLSPCGGNNSEEIDCDGFEEKNNYVSKRKCYDNEHINVTHQYQYYNSASQPAVQQNSNSLICRTLDTIACNQINEKSSRNMPNQLSLSCDDNNTCDTETILIKSSSSNFESSVKEECENETPTKQWNSKIKSKCDEENAAMQEQEHDEKIKEICNEKVTCDIQINGEHSNQLASSTNVESDNCVNNETTLNNHTVKSRCPTPVEANENTVTKLQYDVDQCTSQALTQCEEDEATHFSIVSSASFSSNTSSSQHLVIDHSTDDFIKEDTLKSVKNLKRKLSTIDLQTMEPLQNTHNNNKDENSFNNNLHIDVLKRKRSIGSSQDYNPAEVQSSPIRKSNSQSLHPDTITVKTTEAEQTETLSSDKIIDEPVKQQQGEIEPKEVSLSSNIIEEPNINPSSSCKSMLMQQLYKPSMPPRISSTLTAFSQQSCNFTTDILATSVSKVSETVTTPIITKATTKNETTATTANLSTINSTATKYFCFQCKTELFGSLSALKDHQTKCLNAVNDLLPFKSLSRAPGVSCNSISTVMRDIVNHQKPLVVRKMLTIITRLSKPKDVGNVTIKHIYYKCVKCQIYYENWSLFIHMREKHNRYICLYCIRLFPTAEKLAVHLEIKHDLEQDHYLNENELRTYCNTKTKQEQYLLCCTCQYLFKEDEAFSSHICSETAKQSELNGSKRYNTHPSECHPHINSDSNVAMSNIMPTTSTTSTTSRTSTPSTLPMTTSTKSASKSVVTLTSPTRVTEAHSSTTNLSVPNIEDISCSSSSKKNDCINSTNLSSVILSNNNCDKSWHSYMDRRGHDLTVHDNDGECANSNSGSNMPIGDSSTTRHHVSYVNNLKVLDNEHERLKRQETQNYAKELNEPPDRTILTSQNQVPASTTLKTITELVVPKFKLRVPKEFQKSIDAPFTSSESDDIDESEDDNIKNDDGCIRKDVANNNSNSYNSDNVISTNTIGKNIVENQVPIVTSANIGEGPTLCHANDTSYPSLDEDDSIDEPNTNLERVIEEIERTKKDIQRTKQTSRHTLQKQSPTVHKADTCSKSVSSNFSLAMSPKENDSSCVLSEKPPSAPSSRSVHNGNSDYANECQRRTSSHEILNNMRNDSDFVTCIKETNEQTSQELSVHSQNNQDADNDNIISREIEESYGYIVNINEYSGIKRNAVIHTNTVNNNETIKASYDLKCDNDNDNDNDNHLLTNSIEVAGDDTIVTDLQLDKPLDKYNMIDFIRVCLTATFPMCMYCNYARRVAVNGKSLVLHLIAQHRFAAIVDSITAEELHSVKIVTKLKTFLPQLENEYLNLKSYCTIGDKEFRHPYDEREFECFQCRYTTKIHKEIYLHNRKMHLRSAIRCFMCGSHFFSFSEILCHMCPGVPNKISIFDVKFRCCFCDLDSIPSQFRLMVHLRKQHCTCDICLEDCLDQYKLSSHVWKHKLLHFCYRCGIAYRNKLDITKHLFWKHGTESTICKRCMQKRWCHIYHFCIPPLEFMCETCNLCFSQAMYLRVHKRLHTEDFPHPCTVDNCDEKFISRKLLLKHTITHETVADTSITPNDESLCEKQSNECLTKEPENQEDEKCAKDDTLEHKEIVKFELPTESTTIETEFSDSLKTCKESNDNENFTQEEYTAIPKIENAIKNDEEVKNSLEENAHKGKDSRKKRSKKHKRTTVSLEDLNLTAPNLSESDSGSSDFEGNAKIRKDLDCLPPLMLSPPSEIEHLYESDGQIVDRKDRNASSNEKIIYAEKIEIFQKDEHNKQVQDDDVNRIQNDEPVEDKVHISNNEDQVIKDKQTADKKDEGNKHDEEHRKIEDDKENGENSSAMFNQMIQIWKNVLKTQKQDDSLLSPEQNAKVCNMDDMEDNYEEPKQLHVALSDHDYCIISDSKNVTFITTITTTTTTTTTTSIPTLNVNLSTVELMEQNNSSLLKKSSRNRDNGHMAKHSIKNYAHSLEDSTSSSESTCTCGSNCSCSSSDSDTSSYSSSDRSVLSAVSNNTLHRKHRKKYEKDRLSRKTESISPSKSLNKFNASQIHVNNYENNGDDVESKCDDESLQKYMNSDKSPSKLKELSFHESDLETNESETDEDFYDKHPQKLANEMLVQRNINMLTQDTVSPSQNYDIVDYSRTSTPCLPENTSSSHEKLRIKVKKKKRDHKNSSKTFNTTNSIQSIANQSSSVKNINVKAVPAEDSIISTTTTSINYNIDSQQNNQVPRAVQLVIGTNNCTVGDSRGSSCSDVDVSTLKRSKRTRRPNRFYGYTSDEEDGYGQTLTIGMRKYKPQPPPQLTWCKEDLPTPSKSLLNNSKSKIQRSTRYSTESCGTSQRKSKSSVKDYEASKSRRKSSNSVDLKKLPPIPPLKIKQSKLMAEYNGNNTSSVQCDTASEDDISITNVSSNVIIDPPVLDNKTNNIVLETPSVEPLTMSLPQSLPSKPRTPQATAFKQKIPPALLPNPDFATLQYFKANNIRYPIRPPDGARQARDGESVYCYCRCPYDEVSEMIACDGDSCLIEWFHFECVGIMVAPQGKWFCAECRPKYSEELYPTVNN